MKRRQLRWISVVGAAVAAVGLILVASTAVTAIASAHSAGSAVAPTSPAWDAIVPAQGVANAKSPNNYSGYYDNVVGGLALSATVTVPTVTCRNSTTWGSEVGLLTLADSPDAVSGIDEHGGGVEVGCTSVTGLPTYSATLCGDVTSPKGCHTTADPVAAHDAIQVSVVAAGGCRPVCLTLTVTVDDITHPWTAPETYTGTANSDFNTFVAAVGAAPLADFGTVTLSNVSDGHTFQGQRSNLVDAVGHTLARAGALNSSRTSFSVKWVRSV